MQPQAFPRMLYLLDTSSIIIDGSSIVNAVVNLIANILLVYAVWISHKILLSCHRPVKG